ncbi:MAG TPA: leucine-rich repeat domain-containing protein [bacterium]|nr:leucine-rich repeat domain-containing protein [bacterium]
MKKIAIMMVLMLSLLGCTKDQPPVVQSAPAPVKEQTPPADCNRFVPPWGDEYWEDWGKAHGEEFEKWYIVTMGAMKDLTAADIEKCAHLDNFFVGFSKLDTLTPFAKMPNLRKLDLRFSAGIKDLTPLAGLKNLEELTIWGTGVTDLSPVKDLPKLRRIDAKMTQISDLKPVAAMKNLFALDVLMAPVADITPLADHPALAEVVLCSTKVPDVAPLYGYAERVTYLDLCNTLIPDVTVLTKFKNAQKLKLWGLKIKDASIFSGMADLRYLDLRNTPVASLKPLEKLEKLQTVIVAETKVSKKEIARFKKIRPTVELVEFVE